MTTKLSVGAENSIKNNLLIDINDYNILGPNGTKYREIAANEIDAVDEEDINSCFENIRNGESLKKTIEIYNSRMPKLHEFPIKDLEECSLFVELLIKAKENYYASKGLLGKLLVLFSRAFGSIKDASILKRKIDSNIENQKIVDHLSSELESLHTKIVKIQYSADEQKPDSKPLVDKFEIALIHLNMFSKNEKTMKIFTHFLNLWQDLF